MSDSADGTATGLKPDIIQLDSVLAVSCSTGQAGDTVLTFAGELDAASADRAYRYVRDTIDTHGGPVLLDVTSLSFCDARGLGALLRMSSHARQAGSSLHLLTPPPRLVRLIQITGLDEKLPVQRGERTEEVALARARHHRKIRPCPVAAGQLTREAGRRGLGWLSSIQAAVSLGVPGISRTTAWATAREPRETR